MKDKELTAEELEAQAKAGLANVNVTLTGATGPIGNNDPSIKSNAAANPAPIVSTDASIVARLEELSKIVTDQQKQLEHFKITSIQLQVEKVAPKIPEEPVKHEKKKYMFNVPEFSVPGIGRITAEEASSRPDVIKQLVEMESGILREYFSK